MKLVLLGSNLPESQYLNLCQKISSNEIERVDGKDREETKKVLADADMIVSFGFKLNSSNFDILDSATKLKIFQFPWVGVDDTDFDYAKKRGIAVCNSRWNSTIVAEFTLALLLSSAKLIVSSDATLRQGSWEARGWPSKRVQGSNILMLGGGDIPREIARFLEPFRTNITVVKRSLSSREPINNTKEITWDQYEEAASQSDFIICVLPLTPETKGILDAKKFSAMKKGSVFINVGRGAVVHEEALYNALKSGHLGGAAIDVWYNYNYGVSVKENKCNPGNFPFHELPNIVMSPHRACNMTDSLAAPNYWDTIVHNWNALKTGGTFRDVINFDRGY
jgi:phosphoglycerate dehydrogenase-like enzyme